MNTFSAGTNTAPFNVNVSPSGQYVTVSSQRAATQLMVISTKTLAVTVIPLNQRGFPRIDWSPDEQYFTNYQDAGLMTVRKADNSMSYPVDISSRWASEGHTLFYTLGRRGGTGTSDLFAFYPEDGNSVKLLTDVREGGSFLQNGQMVNSWRENGKLSIGTVDLKTKQHYTLASNNTSFLSNVNVIQNGRKVFYIVSYGDHATAEIIDQDGSNHLILADAPGLGVEYVLLNEQRSVVYMTRRNDKLALEITDLDGTHHRTLVDGLDYIKFLSLRTGFRTFDLGSILWFVAERSGLESVEMLDTLTGEHHILASGLTDVNGDFQDIGAGQVAFYGQNANQNDIAAAYTLQGKRLYYVTLPTKIQSYYESYHLDHAPNQSVIVSLDASKNPVVLYFIAADSTWTKAIVMDAGSYLYGQPAGWSPDSTRYAFTESSFTNTGSSTVRVVDSSGANIQRFGGFSKFGQVSWTTCH